MKDLYWINCSELLLLNYENIPYQEND